MTTEYVNGYCVMHSHRTERTSCCDPGRIVLLDLAHQGGEYRYVVGWVRDGADYWIDSAYYPQAQLLDAEVEYSKRVEREQSRRR